MCISLPTCKWMEWPLSALCFLNMNFPVLIPDIGFRSIKGTTLFIFSKPRTFMLARKTGVKQAIWNPQRARWISVKTPWLYLQFPLQLALNLASIAQTNIAILTSVEQGPSGEVHSRLSIQYIIRREVSLACLQLLIEPISETKELTHHLSNIFLEDLF